MTNVNLGCDRESLSHGAQRAAWASAPSSAQFPSAYDSHVD